jgi:Uma2 family endonuclease
MSLDEFLAWDSGDGRIYQLVDGEPGAMAPANRTHGAIQSELGGLIRNHLLASGSPCSVLTNPVVVPKVRADRNARIPDLIVTCSLYHTEQAVLRDPVLIVEILSPSNHAETWSNVWTYTTIPSVSEILIVRASAIGAELLRREPDGGWPDRPMAIDEDADIDLHSIGFRVPIRALYRTTRLASPADRS